MERIEMARLMSEKKKWENYQRVGDMGLVLFFFVLIIGILIAGTFSSGWVFAVIIIGITVVVGVPFICFGLLREWKLWVIERAIRRIERTL